MSTVTPTQARPTRPAPTISAAAADLIADTIEQSLNTSRVLGFAMQGIDFDGSKELTLLLYRDIEDRLYNLVRDLRGEDEAPGLLEVVGVEEVSHG